ncbi:MAG TPA: SHOCT domain-containing protein [Acidimicrobiia bacterium]
MMMGFGLLLLVVVIGGIVWFAGVGSVEAFRGTQRETPLEILERRFAEGVISSDEYLRRRADLLGEEVRGTQSIEDI